MTHLRRFTGAAMLIALTAGAGFSATPGWTFMSPKLTGGGVRVQKACVMPAEGKLSKVGMKGQEGMSKESEAWSSALQTVAESHLKSAGVEIVQSGMSQEELEKNDELRQVVLKLQSKYESILTQMEKHPKDTRKSRFTVGDEVSLLPCTTTADTLIYVNGKGRVLTGGKKTFGVLVGGSSASTAFLTLSLVDAKSGDVLAYLRMVNAERFVNDSEKAYGKRLDTMFKKMKIGNTGHKKH